MALWNDILDPGDVFGFGQDERVSRANAALAKAQEKAEENSNANRGLYGQYYNKMQNTYGDTAGKMKEFQGLMPH